VAFWISVDDVVISHDDQSRPSPSLDFFLSFRVPFSTPSAGDGFSSESAGILNQIVTRTGVEGMEGARGAGGAGGGGGWGVGGLDGIQRILLRLWVDLVGFLF